MYKKINGIVGVAVGLFSMGCMAQEDPATGYIYATYHECDLSTQGDMDDVVAQYDKPVLDKAVEDGRMATWGYYSHMTGGNWRRLQFHGAETMAEVLENQRTVFGEVYQGNPAAGAARSAACSRHDDYIWGILFTSGPGDGGDPPPAAMSVYYVCDYTREEEADAIFEKSYIPVLNRLTEEDKLAGWTWNAHRVGGEYRRLLSMVGESHEAILAARSEILQSIGGQADSQLDEICGSHSDYLWDIVH